jgi:hypothetical protein
MKSLHSILQERRMKRNNSKKEGENWPNRMDKAFLLLFFLLLQKNKF